MYDLPPGSSVQGGREGEGMRKGGKEGGREGRRFHAEYTNSRIFCAKKS